MTDRDCLATSAPACDKEPQSAEFPPPEFPPGGGWGDASPPPRPAPTPRHRDIAAEVTVREAQRIVRAEKKRATTNAIGCLISATQANTDGYVQRSLTPRGSRRQKSYLLHRLALHAAGKDIPDRHQHASHRCDIRACFNADHIVVESIKANNSRKGCPGDVICPCECKVLAYSCPHNPKCLRLRQPLPPPAAAAAEAPAAPAAPVEKPTIAADAEITSLHSNDDEN